MDKSIVPVNQIAARSSTCYEFSNPNGAEVVEIEDDDTSVEIVERQIKNLKLNYQFNEKCVPQIFQSLIKSKMNSLKKILFHIDYQFCRVKFDETEICSEKSENGWSITCERKNETIRCDNPEKSIIDHLWFVLRNPDLELEEFRILSTKALSKAENRQKLGFEKLDTYLQSMIDSIDHQIQTNLLHCKGFNEDTFLSMLKHVKPGKLDKIIFDVTWKEEKIYHKMEEIVKTGQWKQVKEIYSYGVNPLKPDDLFHCENFRLEIDSVTPKDVLRVVKNVFNASSEKHCHLTCKTKKYDIKAIIDFLQSQNDGSRITKNNRIPLGIKFAYTIVKSETRVYLHGNEHEITIQTTKYF